MILPLLPEKTLKTKLKMLLRKPLKTLLKAITDPTINTI